MKRREININRVRYQQLLLFLGLYQQAALEEQKEAHKQNRIDAIEASFSVEHTAPKSVTTGRNKVNSSRIYKVDRPDRVKPPHKRPETLEL